MTTSPYATADENVLDEIIRQAEARLNAQLTAAVGADQRAMTFAGLLFAGAAALAAIAAQNITSDQSGILIFVCLGLSISGALAAVSAAPSAWEYVGNVPSAWVGDIQSLKPLRESKSEMANYYDDMLATNETAIAKAGRLMRSSMGGAFLSVICGVVLVAWQYLC